jgi:cation-transporting P-type ATPase I
MGVADRLRALVGSPSRRGRASITAGRASVEVRGLDGPDAAAVAAEVEAKLRSVPGVVWASALPTLARVVVGLEEGQQVDLGTLVDAVEDAESSTGVTDRPLPRRPDHPADLEPLVREGIAAVADAAAIGMALAGRLAHLPRLPMEVAGVVPVVQSQPRLHGAAEALIGSVPTDAALAVANALVQGLAQGPLGVAVDMGQRLALLGELAARRSLWETWARGLTSPPATTQPVAGIGARPRPPPPGPVETHADRMGIASVAALAATSLALHSVRRGTATMLSFTPRAATAGRDVFAARLGQELAHRGALCLDSGVLRLLDRLDTLVIGGDLFGDGALEVDRVVSLPGADPTEVRRQAAALFTPHAPQAVARAGPWWLGPVEHVDPRTLSPELRRRRRRDTAGEPGLLLTRDGAPAAVVGFSRSVPAVVRALVGRARDAGLRVVVAGVDGELAHRAGADDRIDGAEGAATGLRRLQADGAAVAAVTTDRAALLAADCGVALTDADDVPWEADILCPDASQVCFVLDAVAVARETSRQSAAVSLAASSAGAALSVLSTPAQAARSAMGAVSTGAALAMANGLRSAAGLARRPRRLAVAMPPWHELDGDEVLERLGTTADGLTPAAAAERRPPESTDAHEISLPAAIVDELVNPMTPVLAGAAAVSGAAGSLADAGLVASVVAANGVLGGVQRYRVERAVLALERTSQARVWVRRSGRWSTHAPGELVVGDVIRLETGDWVPADCRVLTARALEVEQAGLTGESAPVPKGPAPSPARALDERSSMLYEGSVIAAGHARAVVVATAPDTELRRAAEGVTPPPSGVETRLRDLTRVTIPVALAGGAALLAGSLVRGFPVRQSAASGVTLAVAAVPEGLPLLATMAQLAAAHRLSARGVLVRNPRSLEALGRVEVLCCDKTGTLTEGRIALHAVHDGRRLCRLDELGATHQAVLVGALRASPPVKSGGGELPHLTDRAVVDGATGCGLAAGDGLDGWAKVAELPFEPARGYHAVLGRAGDARCLSVKGAPEVVLPRCAAWRDGTTLRALDPRARQRLARTVERLGRRGYRVLAVAERRASSHDGLEDSRVDRLDLLGFVALVDPVRAAGAAAVARLQQAGISVVMLTGDHRSTAEGVAAELGVLDTRRVLTGPELDHLSDAALDAILDEIAVFARVTPSHKTRLVAAYQRRGQAVAMTGDGANDAPAIRRADAGVAFGPQATPAARAAADVVVPDARIETLVDAIVEGRALWTSVREAIAILVGGNLGEIAFTVLGSTLSRRPPLNPRQLLLVNLLTDIAPAIVIATRPPHVPPDQLLAEGPNTSLGQPLERAIAARAVTTTAGATVAWAGGRATGRATRASTISLVGLVGSQLGQTLRSDARNPTVLAASLGSAATLAAIVQTPGVSHFFGCRPLGPLGWGIGLTSAAAATVSSGAGERLVAQLPRFRTAVGRDAATPRHPPTRAELYELARALDVPGRSRMTKPELARAVGGVGPGVMSGSAGSTAAWR